MAFWGFNRDGLIFWAILLDLAGDCVDFAVTFDKCKADYKSKRKQKKEKVNRLAALEKRSQELEAEVEFLKSKLQELSSSANKE